MGRPKKEPENTKMFEGDESFFSEIDKGSEYPAFYFDQQITDLQESINHRNYMLDNDLVTPTEKITYRENTKKEEERLQEIKESRPKLSSQKVDMLATARKELGEKIGDSMFRYSEMERGTADAHEEARRQTEPIIKITSEAEARAAEMCGINVKSGMLTRDQASKVWKIAGKYMGESTDIESLRRD